MYSHHSHLRYSFLTVYIYIYKLRLSQVKMMWPKELDSQILVLIINKIIIFY